jgi:ABC-2 type transport system ATP-binding protein
MRILDMDPLADPVAVKRKVGVLPEDLALFDRLSGAETLSFVGQVHGLDRATVKSRSTELLELMELTRDAGALVADYSHGMRKKIALAAALLPARGCSSSTSRSRESTRSRPVRSGTSSRDSSAEAGRSS